MLSTKEIQAEAQILHFAEKNRKQATATTTRYPDMNIEDAYAIQAAWMKIKKDEGRTVAGYKIGLTSRTMQRNMNINEPDFGTLMDDMILEEGADIETSRFLDPRIEVELAFFLKKPLFGKNLSILDVLNATDFIMPSVELIAARTYRVDPETKYVRTVRDTIADNAANGAIILGGRPIKPHEADLRWLGAMMFKSYISAAKLLAIAAASRRFSSLIFFALNAVSLASINFMCG